MSEAQVALGQARMEIASLKAERDNVAAKLQAERDRRHGYETRRAVAEAMVRDAVALLREAAGALRGLVVGGHVEGEADFGVLGDLDSRIRALLADGPAGPRCASRSPRGTQGCILPAGHEGQHHAEGISSTAGWP